MASLGRVRLCRDLYGPLVQPQSGHKPAERDRAGASGIQQSPHEAEHRREHTDPERSRLPLNRIQNYFEFDWFLDLRWWCLLLPFVLRRHKGIDSRQLVARYAHSETNAQLVDLAGSLFELLPIVEFECNRLGDTNCLSQDRMV